MILDNDRVVSFTSLSLISGMADRILRPALMKLSCEMTLSLSWKIGDVFMTGCRRIDCVLINV